MSRLRERYEKDVVPALKTHLALQRISRDPVRPAESRVRLEVSVWRSAPASS